MYEIDFMAVGDSHGDAICMRYGVEGIYQIVNVIDGGFTEVGSDIIAHINTHYGTNTIDNVVLTHADDDHARGLIAVMENCNVRALRMNRPWLYVDEFIHHHHGNFTPDGLVKYIRDTHPYLVELEAIAFKKGVPIHSVFQGDTYGQMTVLAPSRNRYVSLLPYLDKTPEAYRGATRNVFEKVRDKILNVAETWDIETLQENPPATSASNETSLVQLFKFDEYSALFTGDVGPVGLREAANSAIQRALLSSPSLFQIPHQGSRRNVTPSVLDLWLGKATNSQFADRGGAFCMVGKNKDDHPRKVVSNALTRRGYKVQVGRGLTTRFGNIQRAGWVNYLPEEPLWNTVEDYS